jgi:hypothetical protein
MTSLMFILFNRVSFVQHTLVRPPSNLARHVPVVMTLMYLT